MVRHLRKQLQPRLQSRLQPRKQSPLQLLLQMCAHLVLLVASVVHAAAVVGIDQRSYVPATDEAGLAVRVCSSESRPMGSAAREAAMPLL